MTALAALVATVAAAGLHAGDFRYQRSVPAAVAEGRAAIEPDSRLIAHAAPNLADLRFVDADGRQVPWRPLNQGPGARVRRPATVRGGIRQRGDETLLTLDLAVNGVPIELLKLTASAPARYDRPLIVEASYDGRTFTTISQRRMIRTVGERRTTVLASTDARYIRIRIVNGDDEPLKGIRAELKGSSYALVLKRGYRPPVTAHYGAKVGPPNYDFARLPPIPPAEILPAHMLGPEQLNPAAGDVPEPRPSRRWIYQAAMLAAALAVAVAGAVALRRNG